MKIVSTDNIRREKMKKKKDREGGRRGRERKRIERKTSQKVNLSEKITSLRFISDWIRCFSFTADMRSRRKSCNCELNRSSCACLSREILWYRTVSRRWSSQNKENYEKERERIFILLRFSNSISNATVLSRSSSTSATSPLSLSMVDNRSSSFLDIFPFKKRFKHLLTCRIFHFCDLFDKCFIKKWIISFTCYGIFQCKVWPFHPSSQSQITSQKCSFHFCGVQLLSGLFQPPKNHLIFSFLRRNSSQTSNAFPSAHPKASEDRFLDSGLHLGRIPTMTRTLHSTHGF